MLLISGSQTLLCHCPFTVLCLPSSSPCTVLDASTSSDTDNDRDASSTCFSDSDSFLAVCSHNQSDEDIAMSIKYRGVFFASPSQAVDANVFMHEELMELLIHYNQGWKPGYLALECQFQFRCVKTQMSGFSWFGFTVIEK